MNDYDVTSFRVIITLGIVSVILLPSCSPDDLELPATNTPTSSSTHAPTHTPSATHTQTPTSTATTTPTPTPIPLGYFLNPYSFNEAVRVFDSPLGDETWELTLLEILRGANADKKAREIMSWLEYETPIESQEYIALRVSLRIEGPENEVLNIWPYVSLTLRYEDSGKDLWSEPTRSFRKKGYSPLEDEGWIFFLIRQDSYPMLYFQPWLMTNEVLGYRTEGVYFGLQEFQ